MSDPTEDKTSTSGNVSAEEKLLKSEKIDTASEEKIINIVPKVPSEEKPVLPAGDAASKNEEKKEQVKETASATKTDVLPEDSNTKIVEVKKVQSKTIIPQISDVKIVEKTVKKVSDSVPCCPLISKEKIVRNQSDIFSLKELSTTLQTSIFSVNGSPSRRVFRKQEPAGHVFQRNEEPPAEKTTTPRDNKITRDNYNDEKRPSSSYRNPLTGTGLSSNDEYKSKGTKRKDGNPLLGLGYDEVNKVTSQHRIPPGGYSHKLW